MIIYLNEYSVSPLLNIKYRDIYNRVNCFQKEILGHLGTADDGNSLVRDALSDIGIKKASSLYHFSRHGGLPVEIARVRFWPVCANQI